MDAETIVYGALSGASPVTAIVSTRISPLVVGEKVQMPAICYSRGDTEYISTIHSGVPLGEFAVFEVWCMAKTEDAARTLANAATNALGAVFAMPTNKRHEYDSESEIYAVVLTVRI